jgi:heavy metal efflux system protein
MIDRILEFSLRQRLLVLLGAIGLAAAGIFAALHLPIDAVPDITNAQVQINTEVPALAPEESEKLVTFPMEIAMSGMPGLKEMRSLTKFGLSQVTLVFEDGVDVVRSRQFASERIQGLADTLPPGLVPRLAPISTGLGEIFYYTLDYLPTATNRPASRFEQLMELREIQEYVVKPLLRTTPGIAEVNTAGGYERQLVVQPRLPDLAAAGLTVNDLAAVVAANTRNAGGGIVNRSGNQLVIRAVSRVEKMDEIPNLPVKFTGGVKPIRVKDVADVVVGSAVRTGAATENGGETVLGTAMMLIGQNSRIVAKAVARRVTEIQDQLPVGIVIRTHYDRSELVDRTVDTVKRNLFEGAILVIVVLLALLGNWRAALIVTAAIPLAFFFALIGMQQGGVSGNLMSLGAIDFGLIIDGAVVIVENIVRQLGLRQHHLGRTLTLEERMHVVLSASKQVAEPMFFGVLIITIVYTPILALSGVEGKMFRPMAVTVMLALGGALVLALTLMPALCSYFLGGRIAEKDNPAIEFAKRIYAPVLARTFHWRYVIISGALALFGLCVFLFSKLGAEFVPKLDEGSFTVAVYRTNSMGLPASLAQQMATEKHILSRVPEITRIFSRIGTSEVATDPMPPSQNDMYLFYRPKSEWRKTNGVPISKTELASIIDAEIQAALPGQTFVFQQPIEMRFNELLEGIRSDISVKIIGQDYDVLDRLSAQTKAVLEKIPGVGEVELETQGRAQALIVRVNRDALVKYNLSSEDVNKVIRTALAGEEVGFLLQENRRHAVVVRLGEKSRENLDTIKELSVRVSDVGLVKLGQLVDIQQVSTVEPIVRDEGHRRTAIMINLRGRDMESWVQEAQAKVKSQVLLPEGYRLEFGGQFENLIEAKKRLVIVVPSALLLIFLLVFMAFGSLRQAAVVYSGIPLAMTGGIIALALRGIPFSISAAVGFIALSGVAVLNGLVMVTQFNQLREEGVDLMQAVRDGAMNRLRPVLMTALVASLGFVPMAVASGAGAEVQRPLATVVIGGILSSTLLTLVVLPLLYGWVESRVLRSKPVQS